MYRSQRVLAVLVLLSCAGNVVSTFQKGSTRQSRLPRVPSLLQQRNFTTLPSLLKYASHPSSIQGTLLMHAPEHQVSTIPPLILGCTQVPTAITACLPTSSLAYRSYIYRRSCSLVSQISSTPLPTSSIGRTKLTLEADMNVDTLIPLSPSPWQSSRWYWSELMPRIGISHSLISRTTLQLFSMLLSISRVSCMACHRWKSMFFGTGMGRAVLLSSLRKEGLRLNVLLQQI